jgi:hypothetical protein
MRGGFLRCRLCGLGFKERGAEHLNLSNYRVSPNKYAFPNWNNWLTRTTSLLPNKGPYQFSSRTISALASREELQITSLGTRVAGLSTRWSHGRWIWATLGEIVPASAGQLALGVLATPAAWLDAFALCQQLAPHVTQIVIALDASEIVSSLADELREAVSLPVNLIAHPLRGDFAAQRNRVQEAASAPWVLQLDTDERLTKGALRRLPALIGHASRAGLHAVALPRRNLVDGMVSALYPDVQYRLVRRSVRFVQPVHEYPDLTGMSSFLGLGADILHTLPSERLSQRERDYEALAAGAGRPHDTALLRMPLDTPVAD